MKQHLNWWLGRSRNAEGGWDTKFQGIWCRNVSTAMRLLFWATWHAYQISQNASSAAINHPSHMTQSPWHYKLLSEAASDTILTIQYKKTEANSLSCSENTGWPITWPDTVEGFIYFSKLDKIFSSWPSPPSPANKQSHMICKLFGVASLHFCMMFFGTWVVYFLYLIISE
jgi:hypothetical protein